MCFSRLLSACRKTRKLGLKNSSEDRRGNLLLQLRRGKEARALLLGIRGDEATDDCYSPREMQMQLLWRLQRHKLVLRKRLKSIIASGKEVSLQLYRDYTLVRVVTLTLCFLLYGKRGALSVPSFIDQ
jgi:hypothetical protein